MITLKRKNFLSTLTHCESGLFFESFLAIKAFVFMVLFFSYSLVYSQQPVPDWSQKAPPANFKEAKVLLLKLYQEHPLTFYCDCAFNKQSIIAKETCSPSLRLPDDLMTLEWEHIVPASLLGRTLPCWKEKVCSLPSAKSHRECCQKTSKQFQMREANLYNLVPSIRYANRLRSNYKPGLITRKDQAVRVCALLIDKKKKLIEPDDRLKGFIARTYLMMDKWYDLQLSESDKKLYTFWSVSFPPSLWEVRRSVILDEIYRLSPDEQPVFPIYSHDSAPLSVQVKTQ